MGEEDVFGAGLHDEILKLFLVLRLQILSKVLGNKLWDVKLKVVPLNFILVFVLNLWVDSYLVQESHRVRCLLGQLNHGVNGS